MTQPPDHLSRDADADYLRKRYELILTSIGEGVYGLDADGLTTFVNPAAERMTGWSEQDLLGKVVHEYHHHSHANGEPYARADCHVYQTVKDGLQREVDNEVFWRKDGSQFPVEYVATAIKRDNRIVGAVIVFKDISERKQNEAALTAALQQVKRLKEQLQAENRYLKDEINAQHNFSQIVGQSAAIQHVLSQIAHVAPTDAAVLIEGESGTGKELVARAIHQGSRRQGRPMIKVNCGAIAPSLVESELFGHEKGAFSGAHQRRQGRFELADGGTLFLDEVGELPLEVQVKLLRVLQEGEFERVGASDTRRVNVRIVAATNRDMQAMVARGEFRQDLFYRLSVFPLQVPSLRQRKEDIPLLVSHTLAQLAQRLGKRFEALSPAAVAALQRYHWPGNIRELQNVLEHAAIVGQPPLLDVALPAQPAIETQVATSRQVLSLQEAEHAHIQHVLALTNGVVAGAKGAAALLGVPPSTLRSRMKKLAL